MLLLGEGEERLQEVIGEDGKRNVKVVRKGMRKEAVEAELAQLERSRDVALGRMLRCRVGYFTAGAVDSGIQASSGTKNPRPARCSNQGSTASSGQRAWARAASSAQVRVPSMAARI